MVALSARRRVPSSWSQELLLPGIVITFFCGITWARFLSDWYFGCWGYSPDFPLYYYSQTSGGRGMNLPDQWFLLTAFAAVLATGALTFSRAASLVGRIWTIASHLVVQAAFSYSALVHFREELYAESTRLIIAAEEAKAHAASSSDGIWLKKAKEAYERYLESSEG